MLHLERVVFFQLFDEETATLNLARTAVVAANQPEAIFLLRRTTRNILDKKWGERSPLEHHTSPHHHLIDRSSMGLQSHYGDLPHIDEP